MDQMDPRPIVAGLFRDPDAARDALSELIGHSFEPDHDISVILTDEEAAKGAEIEIREEFQVLEGAGIGGGIGAVLGAAGAGLVAAGLLAGPTALVAMGPVAAALRGALAVGAFGTFAGWVAGLGVQREEVDFHTSGIEEGAIWVGVQATDERRQLAREILEHAGAERVATS